MCNKCHKCFITLQTLTNGSNVSLPDSSRIRKGKITSIMLRRSGALTLKSSTGATVATDAVIGTAHLTLKTFSGTEVTAPLPLSTLQRDFNSPEPFCVNWSDIDPPQCTITLDGAAANPAHVIEIIFGLDCDNCEN